MKSVLTCLLILAISITCQSYIIFQSNISYSYKFEAIVELVPDVKTKDIDTITQWSLKGNIKINRIDKSVIAIQLSVNDTHDGLDALKIPFKLISPLNSGNIPNFFSIHHPHKYLEFNFRDMIWSTNIKRAISTLFQIEGNSENGAYVSQEYGLYGLCPMEYYVNFSDDLEVSKTYDMDLCTFPGGIFTIRSNIPINYCDPQNEVKAHAVMSRLGDYKLSKINNSEYLLKSIRAESRSNVQSSESYYPQFIFSKIFVDYESHGELNDENIIIFNSSEKVFSSDFTYVLSPSEATGGRSPKTDQETISTVAKMLTKLSENLEHKELEFNDPYEELVSEIIRHIETMKIDTLKKLYNQIDIGTSYIQETSRNIFLEILPRVGTVSSVLLAKDLVIENLVRPTTAVQILTALPFFMSELSVELIKECEAFLHLGVDRPDVKHSAVLSYSTMIYRAYSDHVITSDQFEKYVKIFFDLLLNSFDYEQQMLYLEAMGNLQLGNVHNYLYPIIQANYSQTTDFRFLAIFATMPTAHKRSTEIYKTYWPIFYSKTNPLQLRIAAFNMLFVSAKTPGRLLGIFNVIKSENCPHMINFYRTTILSISESTYSCLSHLKRLVLYMRRHVPPAPPKKYWITGNYIFDYKDRKFQIGSMLQVLLIGDRHKDLPLIIFIKFDTEAMGRFTGQVGIYVKARGLSDLIVEKISHMNLNELKSEELLKILKMIRMQPIQSTHLHLEFIVQYEGKTILSYFLNQTTFNNLTDGDIIDRINTVLRTDSHINMQIVRRPYYIKYSFGSLIGTPSKILIENTMIASIRGLTTQNTANTKILRRNEIDLRYSSYAVAKISSYNPINNKEYSTIREQGFLVYLPLNNEITIDIAERSICMSFYRKEPLTSGIAMKSRTRNLLDNVDVSKTKNEVPIHKFKVEDIGIDILMEHNVESSVENLNFLLESDVHTSAKVFTKTPYSIVQFVLTIFSLIQLISIHIGRDKHFTLRLMNEPNSKLEITLKCEIEDFIHKATAKEERVTKIDFNFIHTLNYEDNDTMIQLHRWDFSTKYSSFKNDQASKAIMSLNRRMANGEKWKLCMASTFERMVNFKKPLIFTSIISFGDYEETSNSYCPTNRSTINFSFSIGSLVNANQVYENITVDDHNKCTKEIVKFSPVPQLDKCNLSQLENLFLITDINLRLEFERMPKVFYHFASRLNHMLAATFGFDSNFNISQNVEIKVKLPTNDTDDTTIMLNKNSMSIPINYQIRHDIYDRWSYEYSFTSMCSIYKRYLTTIYEEFKVVKQEDNIDSNEILMLAECSEEPRIAIFVQYKNFTNEFSQVKIYTGGKFITIRGDFEPIIYHDNEIHDLRVSNYERDSSFRVSLKEDSIIQINNELVKAKIEYNMGSLISVSLPTIMRGKLCGLCSNNHIKTNYC